VGVEKKSKENFHFNHSFENKVLIDLLQNMWDLPKSEQIIKERWKHNCEIQPGDLSNQDLMA